MDQGLFESEREPSLLVNAGSQPVMEDPRGEGQTAQFSGKLQAEGMMKKMDLSRLVGQMLIFGVPGRSVGALHREIFAKYAPGGIILYSRNLWRREQIQSFTLDLQELSQEFAGVSLLVAVDQEGGRVVRVREEGAILPSQMAIGATGSQRLAYLAGKATALSLLSLGIHANFSPVLDIQGAQTNPMIGVRSFGGDPELVTKLGYWHAKGMRDSGVLSVVKHFPGHGATVRDSHRGASQATQGAVAFEYSDLLPFRKVLRLGVDAVMTAHAAYPMLDGGKSRPATLSPLILTHLLREELGFDGLVITDDLEMGAIEKEYEIGNAAVQAVLAGADMVMVAWTLQKQKRVHEALTQAVHNGVIPLERIEQSVRRILSIKNRYRDVNSRKLEAYNPYPGEGHIPPTIEKLRWDEGKKRADSFSHRLQRVIAEASVTLLKNDKKILPLLPRSESQRIVLLSPLYRFTKSFLDSGLQQMKVIPLPLLFRAGEAATFAERHEGDLRSADLIVVGVINRSQAQLVQLLTLRHRQPVVAISFGEPEFYRWFPKVSAYLCAYSISPGVPEVAAEVALGLKPPRGKLPVTLSQNYPIGYGLSFR
ncbi:MAG: beta-N-acetylhexosaminidase [Deltaproteobacteria bacterium]|nr:beta-N-acetylhexosaminidase [Deltaproteobacteria bacterium]